MNIVKSFCLWMLLITPVWAQKPVEVVVGGNMYTSIDEYRAAQVLEKLKAKQSEKMRAIKGFKEIHVPKPPQASISPGTAQALHKVGLEDGIRRVHLDFKQNWANHVARFAIDTAQLEENLRTIADGRKEPILIMSERNKLRVMALEKDQNAPQNLP